MESGLDGQRLDRLESIEAIRQLKHRYMHYCDIGYLPEKLGPLFTEDAVWTNDFFGHYEGREAISEHFARVSSSMVFAAHLALNEIINVDGETASGDWRILMPFTRDEEGNRSSRLMLGEYREKYRREDGIWLFERMDFFINFDVEFGEGWEGIAKIRTA